MGIVLKIENIAKNYRGKPVLKNCSFEVDKKGIYVLRGPNGAGKSTLLRICALLEAPDHGNISFYENGTRLSEDMALKRQISLVLPKVGVFNRSVAANVAYPLKIRHVKRRDTMERVDKILEMVGLSHKRDQRAVTLSSGETQRMGIARALVVDPQILFLDEPTASIDNENTAIVENLLNTLKKKGRTSIIMTTHDASQAKRVGDYLLWLKNGQIIADKKVQERRVL
ncbi:MAG: ATP-binding cassette domain-containing protein [Desulfobacterales bacterium]